jgi:hypothetical protein
LGRFLPSDAVVLPAFSLNFHSMESGVPLVPPPGQGNLGLRLENSVVNRSVNALRWPLGLLAPIPFNPWPSRSKARGTREDLRPASGCRRRAFLAYSPLSRRHRVSLSIRFLDDFSGCGAAWIARLTGGQKVAGSNPVTPTAGSRKTDGCQYFRGDP